MVVDHENNDKSDNCLFNLQLLTPGENIYKNRECNIYELKCNLNRPRSFYEDKLTNFISKHIQAKLDKDADLAHKLRGNISATRARLRYYDHHIEEANRLAAEKKAKQDLKKFKRKQIDARKQAAEIKDYLKSVNDNKWHIYARLSKKQDLTEAEAVNIYGIYELIKKMKT